MKIGRPYIRKKKCVNYTNRVGCICVSKREDEIKCNKASELDACVFVFFIIQWVWYSGVDECLTMRFPSVVSDECCLMFSLTLMSKMKLK